MSNWTYVLRRNAANHAITTALIHPSYGIGVGPENLATKVAAADRLLSEAGAAGVKIDMGTDAFVDFWRARAEVAFDATFDTAGGYRGTLTTGSRPVTGLTLEFGDELASFTCGACSGFRIDRRRVVLDTLPENQTFELGAVPR